ncbi:hypothetical protein [Microbacterium sp. CIAB417]|uniref:hypothetical protein n=1 Tax=Microbacterium sp. CIAB417 TaxID=2860287 RepID=UPI001FAD441F|nr:hypothetical protein [Microbacterium sp. CIAB417]
MENGFIWRDAAVTYADWEGTAQLDQRLTGPGIEETVGLNRDEWMVIGIDIGGGELEHDLRVIAVHRDRIPDGGGVLPRIAEANEGEIPATEFLIHDVDPYAVLQAITHVFELRMRLSGASGLPIRVIEQSDVPEQA